MKRFAAVILAGIMVLGSTALGDEIVFDEGTAVENEAVEPEETVPGDFIEDAFAEGEIEIEEESFEEIPESDFSEDEKDQDLDSLIEEMEETADEEYTALAEGDEISIEASFPDEVFRDYVRNEIDTDGNGSLSETEISAVAEIELNSLEISDLSGIKRFTALEELSCYDTKLTSLDLSGCTALTNLYCGENNQLMSLDVSNCTALEYLDCEENQLTSLNVSNCTVLGQLECTENQLTSLDVSSCTALHYLDCDDNELESLDVSKNTVLRDLYCNGNKLTSLDVSNHTALVNLICNSNKMSNLNISGCTELMYLDCGDNQLTDIDVSHCTKMTRLVCSGNQIASLNGRLSPSLWSLYCEDNPFTALNISNCQYLKYAYEHPTSHITSEGVETYMYEEYEVGFSFYCLNVDSSVLISTTHIHAFGDWTITTPATCTAGGVKTRTCSCGASEKEAIPAKGHSPVKDPAVAATTTSEGKTEGSHCSVCGTVLAAQQVIPMLEKITVTKKPGIKAPTAAKNKITVNWSNLKTTSKKTKAIWKSVKKVQVQCATDKAFSNIVKTAVVGKNKTKAVVKGLKAKTTYFIRIRYFDGTGYSKWSGVKKVKTK